MTSPPKLVPSGSQTVGPFFTIGLEYLVEQSAAAAGSNLVEILGRVFDGNLNPVPDAMLEFWGADPSGNYGGQTPGPNGCVAGFRRVGTDANGRFLVTIQKPGEARVDGEPAQAPHLLVLVFARGLLRNLVTRVYFPNVTENASDPVLARVPEARRATLIAHQDSDQPTRLRWDVILQGPDETVFFAW
jgi:protocatechuate 3,4-dioxygenase alpha subunit